MSITSLLFTNEVVITSSLLILKVWGIEIVAMETRLVTAPSDRELLVFKLVTGEGVRSEGVRSEGVRERVGDKRREREGDIKVSENHNILNVLIGIY